ncbi:mtEFG1 [Acrasis kona]|uniref:Elongation factor G, mitochondrial n=1 Tax=Acrasis kona TaxID=1008807 RepID=A0AAW2ZD14_9EUKA
MPNLQPNIFHTRQVRFYSAEEEKRWWYSEQEKQLSPQSLKTLAGMRNIGISAHIDSGKTTLTERILFFTGRIKAIHEVRGTDGVGAKMDSMELEREKGITIKSAATHCVWGDTHVNIIDTPGHVDFTIEVERALRVLDGAIMVLCGVSGVQSQSLTVDRQMKRYKVPRLCFINKLDRIGASPDRVIEQVREKLHLNATAVQIPIGVEDSLSGVIDLIEKKAIRFAGDSGTDLQYSDVPEKYKEEVETKRTELLERLAEVDEDIAELYLNDQQPNVEQIKAAIRRQTIANTFTPVFVGSAKKNCGVQTLLNGVVDYLPSPAEIDNYAKRTDPSTEQVEEVLTISDQEKPFVGLAFKLEEGKYGQLTYVRVYQGMLKRGAIMYNMRTGEKVKVPKLVRMHSEEMEDIAEIGPGEICAVFGVECASGDTFVTQLRSGLSLENMFVPDPVISLSVKCKDKNKDSVFGKALSRFQREDPTFKMTYDPEGAQTIISGMGELHLEIYTERMKREYDCDVEVGRPYVAYRETITQIAKYDYTHKKQSGGSGQYAKVIGYIEPRDVEEKEKFEFENQVIGNSITPNFIAACEKGFREAIVKGPQIECPVWGVKCVITDGAVHSVDSSELAFKTAAMGAFREAFMNARPAIVEPIMKVEIQSPAEFQTAVLGSINKRRGTINNNENFTGFVIITAEVPLGEMFGYSSELRSLTQGKGEYSMDYLMHQLASQDIQQNIIRQYEQEKGGKKVASEGGDAKKKKK